MIGNGKVFVSHTHADNARCEPLLAALDAWRVDYWYDGQQLDAGQQLTPRLQEAIIQREVLLRVCTTNTANSYWMNLEQSAFRATQHQQRKADQRKSIDLILDAGYTPSALERADLTVSAVNKPERVWLGELAEALGVTRSEARKPGVSRRAVVSAGGATILTVAALGAGGVIAKTRRDAADAAYPRPQTIAFANPQALDPRMQWYFKAGTDTGATLAVAGERLFVICDDGTYALNAQDGSILWWRADVQGNALTSASVLGGNLYLTQIGLTGSLTALRPADGSTIWTVPTVASIESGHVAQVNDAIFMVASDNTLVSYSLRDGSTRWRSSAKIVNTSGAFRAPVADDVAVYIGGDDGLFNAFSVADGSLIWTHQTGGAIGYTAALAPGAVYFGSADQYFYALNTYDGSLKWRYTSSIQVNYAPVVSGATVYINLSDHIGALDANTGAARWQALVDGSPDAGGGITGSLTLNGDTLYAPDSNYLVAFSVSKQSLLWRFATRPMDYNNNAPLIAGAMAYWSGADGAVYALDATA